jgi:hypothetical protein
MMVLLSILILCQISDRDSSEFVLDSVYYRYEVVTDTNAQDTIFVAAARDTAVQEGLKIRGAKDFSFDIDEGFNQGLKVHLRGEVEGVQVEGNVSDKATSSSTVTLSEVDKINLKVWTQYFYGGIGNLSLDLPFGIRDEILGGRVGLHSLDKKAGFFVSYAINRGKYQRMRFSGEEGKQSPYFLQGRILPGSERIYIAQGVESPVRLVRDLDYTIDYEQAILSFTNNYIITRHTRIEVEYQEATEDYPSIYTQTDARITFGTLSFNSLYKKQYDDESRPLTFTMSSAERESLALAGDSTSVVHTYADTSSEGSYILQDDHFVYVGSGNGQYEVTFFYVGEGYGDYVYDPLLNGFSYQGTGFGNYTPTQQLPLPGQEEFFGFTVDAFEAATISVFGSRNDKNIISPLDDDDNQGLGYNSRLGKKIGMVTIGADYTHYDEHLVMPTGTEDIDHQHAWNTDERLENAGHLSLAVTPFSFLTVEGSYADLNRRHTRKTFVLKPLFFFLGYEKIDTLTRYFAGLQKETGRLNTLLRYEYTQGTRFIRYQGQYRIAQHTHVGLTGSYDRDPTNEGITTRGYVQSRPVALSLGYRLYNDTTFLFGDANVSVTYKNVSMKGTFHQSQRYSQKRDESFIKVDDGQGNYVYDSLTGSYLEKEGGDYVKKIFLLQDFEQILSRAYSLEAAFGLENLSTRVRFSQVREKDYLNIRGDALVSLFTDMYNVELVARQDVTTDSRYALYELSLRERSIGTNSSYRGFSGRIEWSDRLDEQADEIRERRTSYGAETAYRVISRPLIRPLVAYKRSQLSSYFFSGLDILLQEPRGNVLIGIPFMKNALVELTAELLYRLYSIPDVPYFFAAAAPPGLTRSITLTSRLNISRKTTFNLIYRVEFPPDEPYRQNLRFGTQIRF